MATSEVNLYGRVLVTGRIQATTGLHIGGAPTALAIGAVDNPVIRDALTGRPYIPGSSIRGKMRSLWEKMTGVRQNQSIGRGVSVHWCEKRAEYNQCPVCRIYGVPGQTEASFPTRLIVRDAFLSEESEKQLRLQAKTDLPYTEVKWEAAIDRVTSAAVPRQMERVPAGTIFDGFELIFSIFEPGDLERLLHVFEALQLVEDDYLGGQGSRGSGKVEFKDLRIACRKRQDYGSRADWETSAGGLSVGNVLKNRTQLHEWLTHTIPFEPFVTAAN
jgi:CRISPR-associated protein Csm3